MKAVERRGIMAEPDVDGALVGGASLDAGEFAAICQFHRTSVDAAVTIRSRFTALAVPACLWACCERLMVRPP